MSFLYVIVHEENVSYPDKRKEIDRIKREEDYILIDGDAGPIPEGISKERKIRVCGACVELCVGTQHKSFENNGYDAEIYWKASEWCTKNVFYQ